MTINPERLALRHMLSVCEGHAEALGDDLVPMSTIDRLNRLEQLGWLESADAWLILRQLRNQFAHDYPDSAAERFERLQAAVRAAHQLLEALVTFKKKSVPL